MPDWFDIADAIAEAPDAPDAVDWFAAADAAAEAPDTEEES
jgi:hypothetical protein